MYDGQTDGRTKQRTKELTENLFFDVFNVLFKKTRPDTRQSSRGRLGRSGNAKTARNLTRPDTRPIPVADGWAGAKMHVFPLFDSWSRTDGGTDGRTDGQSLL